MSISLLKKESIGASAQYNCVESQMQSNNNNHSQRMLSSPNSRTYLPVSDPLLLFLNGISDFVGVSTAVAAADKVT